MDSLKSALADKVLEISSLSEESMKPKLEKINRFRDFIDACHTLIARYPAIEEELTRMVINNDFDTKIAASRVDTIIRLADTKTSDTQIKVENEGEIDESESVAELPSEIENQQLKNTLSEEVHTEEINIPSIEKTEDKVEDDDNLPVETVIKNIQRNYNEEEKLLPEDIEYEIVEPYAIEKQKEEQYIDFEEISNNQVDENNTFIDNLVNKELDTEGLPIDDTLHIEDTISDEGSKKETFRKIFKVIIVIAILIALVFIVMFIIKNIKTILIILGIVAAVALLGWWFFIKKKKDTE